MRTTYVVHYSEVALKGKNRPDFLRVLRRNLARSLWGFEPEVDLRDGRFVVTTGGDPGEVTQRLSRQFGVSWVAGASVVEADYDAILAKVLELARGTSGTSFRIQARRSDKAFPLSSHELATRLGAAVASDTGMQVDLSGADVALHVDVTRRGVMVYSGKTSGPGGLPVGTAGRAIHLFSGGIDSPVAAWLLMKRGCVPVYLHFYLAPAPEAAAESKITRLFKVLSAYSGKSTLIFVPFAEYQLATAGAPADVEPSLFRRFMRMTAEAVALRFGATAISTGDSLSQAASQTLWNIAAHDEGSRLPILRPLLTYDKEEIVRLAKKIDTYELSLVEYRDCCAIVTRHPRTRVRAELISDLVERFSLQELVGRSLEASTLLTYNPVGDVTRTAPLAQTAPRAELNRI
jgi:tRNA uracil 4-sulfurtransferase